MNEVFMYKSHFYVKQICPLRLDTCLKPPPSARNVHANLDSTGYTNITVKVKCLPQTSLILHELCMQVWTLHQESVRKNGSIALSVSEKEWQHYLVGGQVSIHPEHQHYNHLSLRGRSLISPLVPQVIHATLMGFVYLVKMSKYINSSF